MQLHAYNRLGSGGGGGGTPSPPSSPRRSPRIHRRPSKGTGGGGGGRTPQAPRGVGQRVAWVMLSILLRRQAIFLFAPLLYVAAMLLYMGSISLDSVPHIISRPAPGSVYRSPQLYERLRADMDADNSTDAIATVWKHSYKGGGWRPCINTSTNGLPESNGYIYIEANGGLNQQRTSICNAVAVAGYLNATLVIPNFHYHSIWRDPSKFRDIYDEDHFIKTLANDVRVVDKVPELIMERFGHNMSNVFNFKVKAWSSIQYYKDAVLPKLVEEKFIRISPFANRLSFDSPSAVQRLRCLANFEALKFSNPIANLAEKLVSRIKERSFENNGKYIAVHLRFEEDMVAFSCCIFDGGEQERQEMNAARERGWRGKFTKPGRVIRPGAIRINGKCPLTPLEVGLMLRGMGFSNSTAIYLASGKIYKAEKTMGPLLEMFPLLQTKETLASAEELAPFKNFSSRMAAIDYSVCLHSEVFVTTQGGNFPQFLIGHRRHLYGGHSKTIKPDKRKLAVLFDNPNIGWKALKRQLLTMRSHSDAKGIEIKRPNDSIYSYPCPDCMCRSNKTEVLSSLQDR
ncbi:protein ESMERALDA 1-like [Typha latifolia]|uniref:protein ESMERALDA 1-like n=1 Tax=Typha latifolia TaxID=4733 RepID=UPI003C2EBA1A